VKEKYTMSGYYEVCGKMGANNLVSGLRGPNDLIFADGQHIRFGYPSYRLGGTVMGDRTIEAHGCMVFEDLTNKRKCVIIMNTYKKTGWIRSSSTGSKDAISGLIYDAKNITGDKESIKRNYGKDMEHIHDLKHLKDVKKEICSIEGSWLFNLFIDGKKYWDVAELSPQRQLPLLETDEDVLLPSDWRYREDLIWLKYGY
jgi:hypothetical protein